MANSTIESILVQQEETAGHLLGTRITHEEKEQLRGLWQELTTPSYRILAEYPTEDGYEQRDSGVECRFVTEYQLWLCNDEEDGFYLASKDEGDTWMLEDKQD